MEEFSNRSIARGRLVVSERANERVGGMGHGKEGKCRKERVKGKGEEVVVEEEEKLSNVDCAMKVV